MIFEEVDDDLGRSYDDLILRKNDNFYHVAAYVILCPTCTKNLEQSLLSQAVEGLGTMA